MTDAKALAAAGESAVKYLTKKAYPATTIAACVRALCLIGGDAALEMLESYADDFRSRVVNELIRGWVSFDEGKYVRNILSQTMRHWISFHFISPPSLEGFEYMTNQTGLSLSKCGQVSDLSPLASLTNLTDLSLSECGQVSDLSPLASLTHLTNLSLLGIEQVSDLNPLASLTNLTDLSLSECGQVSDLSPLASLTHLTNLSLLGIEQVSDLSPLASLTNLTSLHVPECEQVSDLSPLAGLINLTTLDLTECASIKDLSPLENLQSLEKIVLSDDALETKYIPETIKTKVTYVMIWRGRDFFKSSSIF